jgi:FtsH-binding integral membrane protein
MAARQPDINRTDLQQHDLSIFLRPPMTGDAAGTLLGQTMGLVAVTAGLFAVGAYLGRNLASQWGWLLFIAGFGAAGYTTRRDLSALARILVWALIGLILFGIVTIFIQIPNGALIYAVLGLVVFAGLTAFDFQRLRRSQDIRTAPLLAASIFLDILNVFLLLLSLFSGGDD